MKEHHNTSIKINQEFKNLIPPLIKEEFEGLEESILKDGCTDPLIVWNGLLLDGHNRHEICAKHGLPFKVQAIEGVEDENDAKLCIIKRQFGRRNLTTFQKSELALSYEKVESERAKNRQIKNLKQGCKSPVAPDLVQRKNEEEKGRSLVLAAQKAGVGTETVRKVKKILDSNNDDLKEKVRKNKVSIDQAFRQIKKKERRENYQQMEWPRGKFRVILADPPWSYEMKKEGHGDTEDHYDTLSIEQICRLPVRDLVDKECVLFLWVTVPLLQKAFVVLDAWGFAYRTSFVWDKGGKNIGSYSFVNHEYLILATYGDKPLTPEGNKPDSVIRVEKSRKHSEKPEEFRTLIDGMYPNGNRIELFGRKMVKNWEVWGNDIH